MMKVTIGSAAGVILLIVVGFYAVTALSGPNGLPAVREKQRQIQQLREQNANLEREIQIKRQRIEKLRESPSAQELEIRRRLKLLKQKETMFIIPDAPNGKSPASSGRLP